MVDFFFGRDAPFFFFALMLLTSEFLTPSLFFFAAPPDFFTAGFFADLLADFFDADFFDAAFFGAAFFPVTDAGFLPADLGAAFFAVFLEAGPPGFLFSGAVFVAVFFATGIDLNFG
jgi:hypothetical protein